MYTNIFSKNGISSTADERYVPGYLGANKHIMIYDAG